MLRCPRKKHHAKRPFAEILEQIKIVDPFAGLELQLIFGRAMNERRFLLRFGSPQHAP